MQAGVLARSVPAGLLRAGQPRERERFDIYARGYRRRLAEALQSNYPVLHRVLGDDEFEALAHDYIDASPSPHRSIRWFGDTLEGFLGVPTGRLPHAALLDLVRMEWALGLAHDAPDAKPIGATQLAHVGPDDWHALRFALHPSATLLALQWGVEPLWRSLTDDARASAPEPQPCPHTLLVWRKALDVRWRSLDERESQLLELIGLREPFAALCLRLAAEAEEHAAAETAAAHLGRWITDELLVAAG
jgi:hypothetical protein